MSPSTTVTPAFSNRWATGGSGTSKSFLAGTFRSVPWKRRERASKKPFSWTDPSVISSLMGVSFFARVEASPLICQVR